MLVKTVLLTILSILPFLNGYYITDPFTGGKNSFWTAGQPATIKWETKAVDPSSCKSLIIDLMFGNSESGRAIRNIANKISATSNSFTWSPVHSDLPTSDKYFLRLVCVKENPGFSYSSRFTINGPSTDTSYLVPSTFIPGTADDPNVCPECEDDTSSTGINGKGKPFFSQTQSHNEHSFVKDNNMMTFFNDPTDYGIGNYDDEEELELLLNEPIMTTQQIQPFGQYQIDRYHQHNQQYDSQRFEKIIQPVTVPLNPAHQKKPSISNSGNSLIPTRILGSPYGDVFGFSHFNRIQSECFEIVMKENTNIVVSAPTGSGKTGILELALMKMIKYQSPLGQKTKALYLAPTKALCSEKAASWQKKFKSLSIKCSVLTGDSTDLAYVILNDSDVIVATPEKWDSVTRQWKSHKGVLQLFDLILIDEVHLLNEKRGPTLEVIVSRMKFLQKEFQRPQGIRFVAVSATAPNVCDIKNWIDHGTENRTIQKIFDDSYRPVPLEKLVIGSNDEKKNPYTFELALDYQLPNIIHRHSDGKPALVFCSTRKSCEIAANFLAKSRQSTKLTGNQMENRKFSNKSLGDIVEKGVAYHHAGLDYKDRDLIETYFRNGKISVLCCTSTLAVGVNLPARLVIIKGTKQYKGRQYEEYSELDILQMMGRAGRPQYDNKGIAIILTASSNVSLYQNLCQGTKEIESNLHLDLIENLNAEIVLETVKSVSTAIAWLKTTFLYIRMQRNPKHYKMDGHDLERKLEEMILHELKRLDQSGLIKILDNGSKIIPTDFGKSMARYYLRFETMGTILAGINGHSSFEDILKCLSKSNEFEELKFNQGEKGYLNEVLRKRELRYYFKGKLSEIWQRIFCLIQAGKWLQTIMQDLHFIKKHAKRILTTMIDYCHAEKMAFPLGHVVHLMACLESECWPESPHCIRQVERIGKKWGTLLNEAGIRSIQDLIATNSQKIEMILNRAPPLGNLILESATSFPKPTANVSMMEKGAVVMLNLANSQQIADNSKKLNFHFHFIFGMNYDGRTELLDHRRLTTRMMRDGKKYTYSGLALGDITGKLFKIRLICEECVGFDFKINFKITDGTIVFVESCESPIQREMSRFKQIQSEEEQEHGQEQEQEEDASLVIKSKAIGTSPTASAGSESLPNTPTPSARNHGNNTFHANVKSVEPLLQYVDCQHRCKDKTKCRHLCCKEGIPMTSASRKSNKASSSSSSNLPTPMSKKIKTLSHHEARLSTAASATTLSTSTSTSASTTSKIKTLNQWICPTVAKSAKKQDVIVIESQDTFNHPNHADDDDDHASDDDDYDDDAWIQLEENTASNSITKSSNYKLIPFTEEDAARQFAKQNDDNEKRKNYKFKFRSAETITPKPCDEIIPIASSTSSCSSGNSSNDLQICDISGEEYARDENEMICETSIGDSVVGGGICTRLPSPPPPPPPQGNQAVTSAPKPKLSQPSLPIGNLQDTFNWKLVGKRCYKPRYFQ